MKKTRIILLILVLYLELLLLAVLQAKGIIGLDKNFTIASLEVSFYFIHLVAGFTIAFFLLQYFIPDIAKKVEAWGVVLFVVFPAIVFARVWHVLIDFRLYQNDLFSIFDFKIGGLVVFGAFVGGLLGIYFVSKWKKVDFGRFLGNAAIVIPLGQAIGRLGNIFNQEVFGSPTNLPWGIFISPQNRPSEYLSDEVFQPIAFYESLANMSLFLLMLVIYRYRKVLGINHDIFFLWMYMICYGCIRFIVEFLRVDKSSDTITMGLSFSQIISALMVFSGLIGLLFINSLVLKPRNDEQS